MWKASPEAETPEFQQKVEATKARCELEVAGDEDRDVFMAMMQAHAITFAIMTY